jgi:cytochrome c oxidase cbb3-type subunit 2
MRTGPDLANIGARQPSEDWHYLHLYDPELTSPGSIMPPFPFLFEQVPKSSRRSKPKDALNLPAERQPEGAWIVPTERARALVQYLKSLDHTYPVSEGGGDGG